MKVTITSLITGIIFAIGLGLSGMMDPKKVIGFLNITGKWDPSLMMVMGGAIIFNVVSFRLIIKKTKPLFSDEFSIPALKKLDKNVLIGPAIFGIGWGLAGICPGPAIANLASLSPDAILFVASMTVGMLLFKITLGKNT